MQNNELIQRLSRLLPSWRQSLEMAENCTRNAIRWRIERGSLFEPRICAILITQIDATIAELETLKGTLGAASLAHAGRTALAGRHVLSLERVAKWRDTFGAERYVAELQLAGWTWDGAQWSMPDKGK